MLGMTAVSRELDHWLVSLRRQMEQPGLNQTMSPMPGPVQQRTGSLLL